MRRLGALVRGLPADAICWHIAPKTPPKPQMASTSEMRRFFGKTAAYVG